MSDLSDLSRAELTPFAERLAPLWAARPHASLKLTQAQWREALTLALPHLGALLSPLSPDLDERNPALQGALS